MIMKLKLLLYCFIILGFIWTLPVFAVQPASILVNISPSNPAPFENTTITLNSFSSNLDTVLINWLVNGKTTLSGIGKKSFLITTGAAGTELKIQVKIFLPDGEIDKNITLAPSEMVLLWQADDSYVPPFYKGKALPSVSSKIKIVAMPEIKNNGRKVNSKNMTYSWQKDYNNMQNDSGYGKNFFSYIDDYLEDSSIVSVIASTIDQKFSSESEIQIMPTQPKILFYKEDANLGTIWETMLSDAYKISGEGIIKAEPYFISPKDLRRPELVFSWSINDNPVSVSSLKKNLMPLKVDTESSGQSKLKLEIENKDKIFQTVNKEINVNF